MKITYKISGILVLLILVGSFSCTDFKDPGSIFDPNNPIYKTSAEVTDVIPAVAGSASEITIKGSGFSPNIEENTVVFTASNLIEEGKYETYPVEATIKAASETELTVFRPSNYSR